MIFQLFAVQRTQTNYLRQYTLSTVFLFIFPFQRKTPDILFIAVKPVPEQLASTKPCRLSVPGAEVSSFRRA